jgi:hypothetical protein
MLDVDLERSTERLREVRSGRSGLDRGCLLSDGRTRARRRFRKVRDLLEQTRVLL